MNKNNILLIFYGCFSTMNAVQEAVCIVPVADLTGERLTKLAQLDTDAYQKLPLNGPAQQVKRIDQLIFNEHVLLLETGGEECRIQVPTHGYGEPNSSVVHHEYWTLAKNIAVIDALEDATAIPEANQPSNTITLLQPFYDHKHHQTYSLGTTFKLDALQDDQNYYRVLILSPQLKTGHLYIPKEVGSETHTLTHQDKIKQFINILNFLADQPYGYVPYVLGGNSFVRLYKNGAVTKDKATTIWSALYPTKNNTHSGFDCASLVHRIALTVGIPLPIKNSSALKNYLTPLREHEVIENGDIIYIPGHIIVLVDKDNNMVVEARTQTHGYGYVHRVPLAELFKEIVDTDTLIKSHYSHQPISRLNAQKEVIARLPITILKLNSAFAHAKPEIAQHEPEN